MVKVGVVIFNRAADVAFPLTELTEENYATIADAIRKTISSGSNTHGDFLRARKCSMAIRRSSRTASI